MTPSPGRQAYHRVVHIWFRTERVCYLLDCCCAILALSSYPALAWTSVAGSELLGADLWSRSTCRRRRWLDSTCCGLKRSHRLCVCCRPVECIAKVMQQNVLWGSPKASNSHTVCYRCWRCINQRCLRHNFIVIAAVCAAVLCCGQESSAPKPDQSKLYDSGLLQPSRIWTVLASTSESNRTWISRNRWW